MRIAHTLDQELAQTPVVLTIGVFDGMHLGHQELISTAVERARTIGRQSAVLTFDPHPDSVVHPDRPLQLITSLEERTALIEALGPDMLLIAPFDRTTMSTPADDYMRQIAHALPMCELWIGDDFALGRKREGNIARLTTIGQELGYTVHTVNRVIVDGQPVSSTRVREALTLGKVADLVPLLGRSYWVQGVVVHGDHRGRTIGFPTANLLIANNHMLPADGVYACYVHVDGQRHKAVTNIGKRPTFDGLRHTVEAHLLDFNGDLYDQSLRLTFIERLRGEQRFQGIGELVAQIGRDADLARSILAH